MIECGQSSPIGIGVARVTGRWESHGNVTRIRGPGEIRLMAAVAVGRQRRVVVIRVALRTSQCGMRSQQREYRRMIESRRSPVSGRVTQGAIGREAARHVRRIRSSRKIRLMAAIACRWQRCVVVIRVATRASDSGMCARQRERRGRVIKTGPGPIRSRMTSGARGGEADGRV